MYQGSRIVIFSFIDIRYQNMPVSEFMTVMKFSSENRYCLTHRGLNKKADILQTTFSNKFSNKKFFVFVSNFTGGSN